MKSAIVIGAGIAGLACATELARAGLSVTLFDKGRRPGGRVATRRTEGLTFNHGAQFATARGDAFAALLTQLQDAAKAAPWQQAGPGRIAFLPGMSALPAAMTDQATDLGVSIQTERHAACLHPSPEGWTIRHFPAAEMRPGQTADTGGERSTPADALIIAAPAPQAAALLATAGHAFAAAAARAVIAPCWAVMAKFPSAVPGAAVLEPTDSPIAWAAREQSRPGRSNEPEAWTLHATPTFSREHLEASPEEICQALLKAFTALTGAAPADWSRAHRWRHAQVETPATTLWDAAARIGICGDWCQGPRIEAAYDSGQNLAAQVLAGH